MLVVPCVSAWSSFSHSAAADVCRMPLIRSITHFRRAAKTSAELFMLSMVLRRWGILGWQCADRQMVQNQWRPVCDQIQGQVVDSTQDRMEQNYLPHACQIHARSNWRMQSIRIQLLDFISVRCCWMHILCCTMCSTFNMACTTFTACTTSTTWINNANLIPTTK